MEVKKKDMFWAPCPNDNEGRFFRNLGIRKKIKKRVENPDSVDLGVNVFFQKFLKNFLIAGEPME